jgi:hypothetical protein
LRVKALVLVGLCATLPLQHLQAQRAGTGEIPLPSMARVRVHASVFVTPLVANYLESRGDTLVFVETGTGRGVWSVTLDQVQHLETSVGLRTGYGPYIARGAVLGAGGGALGGLLFSASFKPSDPSRKYSRPLTAGVGAVVGAAIGALVGSRFRVEQWTTVPIPRRVSVLPESGRRLQITFGY